MKSRILALAVLVPVVAVSAGWTPFGKSEPSGPPTDEDVRIAVKAEYVRHVRCAKVDDKGGYVCSYRKDTDHTLIGDTYMSRLTWESGGWRASRP